MHIKFSSDSKVYEDCTLKKLREGVVKLHLKNEPLNPYSGFKAYLDKDCTILIGNYEEYRAKYMDTGSSTELVLSTGKICAAPPETEAPVQTPEETAEQEQQRKIDELQAQIAAYKTQIDATDYRIIKAYEYSMVGLKTQYDMEALHKERQSYRDAINALEENIKCLKKDSRVIPAFTL